MNYMDDAIRLLDFLDSEPEYKKLKERDKAKEPIIDSVAGMGGDEIRCPSCGWAIGEKQKHCDGCGQRIDWSEEGGRRMKTELKPCPFCGATVVAPNDRPNDIVATYQSATGCWHVVCYACMTTIDWYDTESEAIEVWNRRADK